MRIYGDITVVHKCHVNIFLSSLSKHFFMQQILFFLITNYYFMAMTNPFLTTQNFCYDKSFSCDKIFVMTKFFLLTKLFIET